MENNKFNQAYKHYYSLSYDERLNYRDTLINSAETVQDCIKLITLLNAESGTEVRSTIIDRMKSVAKSPEDKAIAEQYKKWTNLREFGDFFTINLNFVYIFV